MATVTDPRSDDAAMPPTHARHWVLGFAVSLAVIAYLLRWTGHNWAAPFYVSAVVYFLGLLCWLFIDPVTPLEPRDGEAPRAYQPLN